MKYLSVYVTVIAVQLLFSSCANKATTAKGDPPVGLKDVYSNYFPVGVAVSPQALKGDERSLILAEFNSITAENAMKMGPIHPSPEIYNWKDADSIVAFAQQNNLRMRGHTLCWHNQVGDWFFKDSDGKDVSKEVLLARLKDHITTVVSRYKGKIYAWDVVNEVISDNKNETYRNSAFYRICGDEYIARAFEYAHAADPKAILFYNDYNEIDPVKRGKIISMLKDLLAKGVPVHAMGLQGHWAINEPSEQQLDSTLREFSQLGIPLQITELDISVYKKEHNARPANTEDADDSFSAAREQAQGLKYEMIFRLFRKYRSSITGVTFWNVSDRASWLDNFPVTGRKDYPLLFNGSLQRKRVYNAVTVFEDGK